MKLKVCGLKEEQNIEEILQQSPDFIGFIFYRKSPRFVDELKAHFVRGIEGPVKVGVFVNSKVDEIVSSVEFYGLDMVQLHGEESLAQVQELKRKGLSVIKVFRVLDVLPDEMEDYEPYCDLFLFDTRTPKYGGSGKKFDWSILKGVNHPFLLSGGIGMDDLEEIKSLNLKNLIGLDVNSKVEIKPGLKDVKKVKGIKALI